MRTPCCAEGELFPAGAVGRQGDPRHERRAPHHASRLHDERHEAVEREERRADRGAAELVQGDEPGHDDGVADADAVAVDDIRAVAKPALRHRLILNFEGEAEGIEADTIIDEIMKQTKEAT